MKKSITITTGAILVAMAVLVSTARPAHAIGPNLRAQMYNWHGNYAYTPYGRPTALVVPPTANLQTNWSWGAASSSVTRIDHQFTRDYLGPGAAGGTRSTPHWPRQTNQLGVYYVRGPWYPTQSQNRLARGAGPCDCVCAGARKLASVMKRCKRSGRCNESGGCCDQLGCCDELGCCDQLGCCDEQECCDQLGGYREEPQGCCNDWRE